jgi:hypothetical protein
MKNFRQWVIVIVPVLFFIHGCATYQHETGTKIDSDKVGQVIEGKTTEAEAVALLGTPQMVQERPDGSKVLVYMHYQTKIFGRPSISDTKGSTSSSTLFLGIRDGVVKKKWQQASNIPTRSVSGQTLAVPDEYK